MAADTLQTVKSFGLIASTLRITCSSPYLTRAGVESILLQADRLEAAAAAPHGDSSKARPLLGKNLALLCRPQGAGSSALQRAAAELGARVAQVNLGDPLPTATALHSIAQLLGRLYDAIDCGTMAPALVQQIDAHAGVPVYPGLDSDAQPARALAMLARRRQPGGGPPPMIGDAAQRKRHRFVMQAMLIDTMQR